FATDATLSNDVLYQIDPTTGVSTPIGTGTGFGLVIAGVFVNNTLYGFTVAHQILTIDTTTGKGAVAGTYSLPGGSDDSVFAAAALSAVPEGSTLTMPRSGAVTLLAASVLRRRRRPKA